MQNGAMNRGSIKKLNNFIQYFLEAMDEPMEEDFERALYLNFDKFEQKMKQQINDEELRESIFDDISSLMGEYENIFFELGFKIGLQVNRK